MTTAMTGTSRTVDLDGPTHYLDFGGPADGPLIVAVHGMTSSRKSWQRLAEHWNGRARVAAYDQRGHGDSAAVSGPMALERGVADLTSPHSRLACENGCKYLVCAICMREAHPAT